MAAEAHDSAAARGADDIGERPPFCRCGIWVHKRTAAEAELDWAPISALRNTVRCCCGPFTPCTVWYPDGMKAYTLRSEVQLPGTRAQVFPFFADAANLQRITPPWLRFEMLMPPPVEMGVGTLLDYGLRVRGVPIRWRSEITAWDPPRRFVDEQRRGPYRFWVHEHVFTVVNSGTLVSDTVNYGVYLGFLVQRLFVGPDLRRIFEYRKEALQNLLGQ